jgi:hypothetical protein
MPVKTETRTVRGIEITCTQFPARRALVMLDKVSKMERGQLTDLESWPQQILACSTALVDDKQIPLDRGEMIDRVFSGNLPALADAIRFAIEVNFSDFSQGAPESDSDLAARPDGA